MASPSHESPESSGITRRVVCRVLGVLFTATLAEQITFGVFPGPAKMAVGFSKGLKQGAEAEEDEHLADHVADEVIKVAREKMEHENMNPNEALITAIDLIGSANFFKGVRDLLPDKVGPVGIPGKPVGHINSTCYAIMAGLSVLKYMASDEQGKHHLKKETEESLKALGIIAGTIVAAEGLKIDLEKALAEAKGKNPDQKDRVAMMMLLSSVASPVSTTVGGASLIRNISNEMSMKKITDPETGEEKDVVDEDFATVCVSHISDLSGYLLFGDPPFIAICEQYGFEEGIKWQAKTMWPLALYSLLSATFKANLILAKREGLTGVEASKKAMADSVAGLVGNIPALAKIMMKSLGNFAKYFSGADLKSEQDKGGIQAFIGERLVEALDGIKGLVFSDAIPPHMMEEEAEGMVHGDKPEVKAVDEVMRALIDAIRSEAVTAEVSEESSTANDIMAFMRAIEAKDFETARRLAAAEGFPYGDILLCIWQDFDDNQKLDGSPDQPPIEQTLFETLNPVRICERATDINRIKGHLGHNLGDVVDVFPFQAGSVPFLAPIFEKGVKGLESIGLSEGVREAVIFFAIMVFSMMADNYVACKIGLKLLPHKPQIPLIAAVQGGSMSSIGNMANVAQFSLDKYPLAVSIAKMYWHLDNVAVGFAWAKALDMLSGMSEFFRVPEPIKEVSSHAALGSDKNGKGIVNKSKRDLFDKALTIFRGGAPESVDQG